MRSKKAIKAVFIVIKQFVLLPQSVPLSLPLSDSIIGDN